MGGQQLVGSVRAARHRAQHARCHAELVGAPIRRHVARGCLEYMILHLSMYTACGKNRSGVSFADKGRKAYTPSAELCQVQNCHCPADKVMFHELLLCSTDRCQNLGWGNLIHLGQCGLCKIRKLLLPLLDLCHLSLCSCFCNVTFSI